MFFLVITCLAISLSPSIDVHPRPPRCAGWLWTANEWHLMLQQARWVPSDSVPPTSPPLCRGCFLACNPNSFGLCWNLSPLGYAGAKQWASHSHFCSSNLLFPNNRFENLLLLFCVQSLGRPSWSLEVKCIFFLDRRLLLRKTPQGANCCICADYAGPDTVWTKWWEANFGNAPFPKIFPMIWCLFEPRPYKDIQCHQKEWKLCIVKEGQTADEWLVKQPSRTWKSQTTNFRAVLLLGKMWRSYIQWKFITLSLKRMLVLRQASMLHEIFLRIFV